MWWQFLACVVGSSCSQHKGRINPHHRNYVVLRAISGVSDQMFTNETQSACLASWFGGNTVIICKVKISFLFAKGSNDSVYPGGYIEMSFIFADH